MIRKPLKFKMYASLFIPAIFILSMVLLSSSGNAATVTPTIRPTPTRTATVTPTTRLRSGIGATTRPATNITSTTVTFSANISSGGHQIEIWYEYWEAATPDAKMTTPSRSYYNIATIDYRDVIGLRPNTPYVYRVVMRCYSYYPFPLTAYKNQVSFTTLP